MEQRKRGALASSQPELDGTEEGENVGGVSHEGREEDITNLPKLTRLTYQSFSRKRYRYCLPGTILLFMLFMWALFAWMARSNPTETSASSITNTKPLSKHQPDVNTNANTNVNVNTNANANVNSASGKRTKKIKNLRDPSGIRDKEASTAVRKATAEREIEVMLSDIREFHQGGVVMATSEEGKAKAKEVQEAIRSHYNEHYATSDGRVYVEMMVKFPASMASSRPNNEQGDDEDNGRVVIEMAPLNLVPYSVYHFIRHVVEVFKGGAFHRNAGHVLQAMLDAHGQGMAWQEYHEDFPHKKYTLGFAGRPGGPAFYISTIDNTENHGPGSQGSQTEADGAFGLIYSGIAVVRRMRLQPGADKNANGFIPDDNNHIIITSLKVLKAPPSEKKDQY